MLSVPEATPSRWRGTVPITAVVVGALEGGHADAQGQQQENKGHGAALGGQQSEGQIADHGEGQPHGADGPSPKPIRQDAGEGESSPNTTGETAMSSPTWDASSFSTKVK